MKIALSDFEFDIKGSGSKTVFVPFFMKFEDRNRIQQYTTLLDENLNKKKDEIPLETIDNLFISDKIGKTLLTSINRFYQFQTFSLEEIIGFDTTKDSESKTNSRDIGSFLKEASTSYRDIMHMSASEIRSVVFDYVNSRTNGYIGTSERKEVIQQIEDKLKLPRNTLEKILYHDIDSERKLTKKSTVEHLDVIAWFNYDIIETTLSFALDFQIKVSNLPGYLAKNIVYISKKNYVYTEIILEEDGYTLTIIPPLEMFKERGGWGKNISNVAMYIIRNILKEKFEFELQAIVMPRNRKALFAIDSNNLPILPSFKVDEEEEIRPEIDSKIEDRFFKTWKNYHGWKAQPEPDALIIGKKMYVPDFLLERGENKIYVEIVGFYTTKYIQKKKNQMKELSKLNIPILYLIDQNIMPNFSDLRDVPLLAYSGNTVPSNELTEILENRFSDYEERLPQFRITIQRICDNLDEDRGLMTLQQIEDNLQAYSSHEVSKILSESEIKKILQSSILTYIPSFGFVSNKIISKIEVYLNTNKRILLSKLKEDFPEYREAVLAISQHLGCKTHWKSIEDVEIITPRR